MALLEGYQRFIFARGQFGHERVLTATITGNNPVNGVDELMHEELARVFTELQQDKGSDIIVLTGAGRAFCAGGDFDWFEEQIAHPNQFRDIGWDAKRIVTSLLDIEKPVICRMNGAAAGLGATIQPGAATLRLRSDQVALVPVSNPHALRPNLLVSLSDDELSPAALAARVVLTDVARTLVREGRWIGASFHEA